MAAISGGYKKPEIAPLANLKYDGLTRGRVFFVALSLCHALACRLIHEYMLATTSSYTYMGIHWYDAPVEIEAAFVLLAILPAATFIPVLSKHSETLFLGVLFGTVYIPSVALIPNLTTLPYLNAFTFSVVLMASFWLLKALATPAAAESRMQVDMTARAFDNVLYFSSAMVLISYAIFTPALITSFDLSELYTARAEFFDAASRLPGPVIYIFGNAAFALAPIMVARGVLMKNNRLLFLGLFLGLATFMVTSLRSMLFGVLLVALLSYLSRLRVPAGISVMCAFVSIAIVTVGIDILQGALVPDMVFSLHYRLFGNSAVITDGYTTYFESSPYFYYSQSILSPFFTPPTDAPYQVLVGERISDVRGNHANGNLAADAFANGGYIAVAISFIVLALILRLYKSVSSGKDARMQGLALVVPAFYLSNAGVHTAMLSGGLLATILLMAIYPTLPARHRARQEQAGSGLSDAARPQHRHSAASPAQQTPN